MKKIPLLILMLSLNGYLSLFAQNPFTSGEDSLAVENIRIEGLLIKDKPEPKVPVPDIQFTRPNLRFTDLQVQVPVELPSASIRIAPPLNQPLADYDSRYIKLGGGRFGTTLGDIYWYNGKNRNIGWGADLHHRGMANGFVPKAEFIEHYGNASVRWYKNKHSITGKLFFHQADYHHYGDPLLQVNPGQELQSKRNWFRMKGEAGLKRNDPSKPGTYEANFHYRMLSDNRNNLENHFTTLLQGKTRLQDRLWLKGTGEITFTGAQQANLNMNRNFIHLRPTMEYHEGRLRTEAGLGFNNYSDTLNETYVYPHAAISYEIFKDRMNIGAEITGGMQYNTLYDRISENRYLDTFVSILPSRDIYKASFFISGKWAQILSWKVTAHSRKTNQQVIYFSQPMRSGYFDIQYDTGFVQNGIRADITLNRKEKWDAGISFSLNNNQTGTAIRYFHQPAWMAEGFITWIPVPVLRITLKNYTLGPRVLGLNPATMPDALVNAPAFSDIGIQMDYRFYKRFSLFLEANNIANQTYQRWYLYPERPLDFRAGLTAVF